ncbi:MAG TPA: response regulator [Verrucomicrobiae bacterium]|nr:response regulator [Verrucomicrobiae bacterium]
MNNTPSILLAEDSDDDAYFFHRALKKTCRPCRFLRASNGKLAIQMLEKMLGAKADSGNVLDLIFLDLKMPVMSGFEVLEWIQAAHQANDLRIIVLSGSNDQADRDRAASLGASGYLVKPITPQDLENCLASLSGNKLPATVAAGEAF